MIYLLSSSKDRRVLAVLRTVDDRRCYNIETMRCCGWDCGCWEDPDVGKIWRPDAPEKRIRHAAYRDPGFEETSTNCPTLDCGRHREGAFDSGGATTDSDVLAVAVVVAVVETDVVGRPSVAVVGRPDAVAMDVENVRTDATLVRCVPECVRRKCPRKPSFSRNRFHLAFLGRRWRLEADTRNSHCHHLLLRLLRERPPSSRRWGIGGWKSRRRRTLKEPRRDKSTRKGPSYWGCPSIDDDDYPNRSLCDTYENHSHLHHPHW